MTSVPSPLVLVIDDEVSVRQLVTYLLSGAGFRVAVAADGFQGLKLATENPPDVILMDLELPGMKGVEATAYLKRQAATRNIPVIAFTGQTLLADTDRLLARGFSDFVPKTSDATELVEVIKRVLNQ